MAAADGAAEEKNEMEELKQLLPDIRGKVEDAKESQRTAIAASQAIQQTLVSTLKCIFVFPEQHLQLPNNSCYREEPPPHQRSCVKMGALHPLQHLLLAAR